MILNSSPSFERVFVFNGSGKNCKGVTARSKGLTLEHAQANLLRHCEHFEFDLVIEATLIPTEITI